MKQTGIQEKNYTAVYHMIYEKRETSKQEIAEQLGMSLPTVAKYLSLLEENGLIERKGTYASTGGRPADIYRCRREAMYAVGAEMTAEGFRIAVVDLYGYILKHEEDDHPFRAERDYIRYLCERIDRTVRSLPYGEDQLLGITVAVQGIVAGDGSGTMFSGLLGNAEVSVDDFRRYLKYPVQIVHDAEAAGYAELWQYRDLDTAAYLSLNPYMGSAMIVHGELMHSPYIGAGTIEHMVLDPEGEPCYCGSRGCADTRLGLHYLEQRAGCTVEAFFRKLSEGDPVCTSLFQRWLQDLATVIYNVRMVTDCDVILGGRLETYLRDEDYREIIRLVSRRSALGKIAFRLIPGHYADKATVIGAGLMRIREFLDHPLR